MHLSLPPSFPCSVLCSRCGEPMAQRLDGGRGIWHPFQSLCRLSGCTTTVLTLPAPKVHRNFAGGRLLRCDIGHNAILCALSPRRVGIGETRRKLWPVWALSVAMRCGWVEYTNLSFQLRGPSSRSKLEMMKAER